MAYRGDRIGIGEMFETLVANGRSRHEAAVELHHALSDGAIVLWYGGQPIANGISTIGRVLRDFALDPRKVEPGLGSMKIVMAEALAERDKFEAVCGLGEVAADATGPRLTAEQACERLILSLKEGPRMKKAEVYTKALAAIPDLKEKEFDRAWRSTAGDWTVGGR